MTHPTHKHSKTKKKKNDSYFDASGGAVVPRFD